MFLDKTRGTPLGLGILGIFIVLVWYFVRADGVRLTLLSIVVTVLFLIWTLAQAYFMSMPISTTTAQIAAKFEEPQHKAFPYLVLGASVGLPGILYPYIAWKVLPLLGVTPGGLLDYLWVVGMIALVGILWFLILRFLRPIMDKQDAIIFGEIAELRGNATFAHWTKAVYSFWLAWDFNLLSDLPAGYGDLTYFGND